MAEICRITQLTALFMKCAKLHRNCSLSNKKIKRKHTLWNHNHMNKLCNHNHNEILPVFLKLTVFFLFSSLEVYFDDRWHHSLPLHLTIPWLNLFAVVRLASVRKTVIGWKVRGLSCCHEKWFCEIKSYTKCVILKTAISKMNKSDKCGYEIWMVKYDFIIMTWALIIVIFYTTY